MQKITIKELVDFRRKSTDRSKKNFAYKLKNRTAKEKENDDSEGGGDYWVTSTSCIYNVFKHSNNEYYDSKIDELRVKFQNTDDKRIKSMYQRNLDILTNFKDFQIQDLRPPKILKFETVHKANKIITVDNFPLYLNPSLVFSHERNGKNELGALWLIPQLEGFKKTELGMFCEILYRFLVKNYSENYQISNDYCIAVDTFNAQKIIYPELSNGNIPFLIDKTLTEIRESK